MKKLSQFLKFDMEAFSRDKVYVSTGQSPWNDFDTKEHLGTKIEAFIAEDKTPYKCKDGEVVSNRFEKIIFKIKKDVNVPVNARVMPVNPVAVVYGDYRNQLSVTADDIRVIASKNQ